MSTLRPRTEPSRKPGIRASYLFNQLLRRRLVLSYQGTTLRLLYFNSRRVLSWVNIPFNPAFLRNGFIVNTEGMAQVIRNALASKGIPPAPLSAVFPGFQSLYRVLHLPRAKDVRPGEAIPREARRLMAFSERENYLFWRPVGGTGAERLFIALLVPRAPLTTFIETLRVAGLRPYYITLAPLALLRAAGQKQAIVASVESNSIDIVITTDAVPAVVRSLFLGDEWLTHESGPSRLAEELVRTLSYYNDANPNNPLPPQLPIYVAGAFVGEDMAAVLTRETGHPVMEIRPKMAVPDDFPGAAMAVNLGLA